MTDKISEESPDVSQPAAASSTPASPLAGESAKSWLQLSASPDFPAWLIAQHASIAFTTYQAGKLLMIGVSPDGRLAIAERTFPRCMGLWADATDGRTLWVSSLFQMWRLEDALSAGQTYGGHDRLYVPREGITTGNLDVHDVAQEADGRVVFINTLFSCLATISRRCSFAPVWQPRFISRLMPEDRCHLNGLALENGRAAYVTTCSGSDVADGWRADRADGGSLIDVRNNETLATGLSMPHSPRAHEGKIYLHNSGTGEFGWVDRSKRQFVPVCFCPGYLRGLAFLGHFAVVGLSRARDRALTGLKLESELARRGATPMCGLQVIDLRTGDVAHWVKLEGLVSELYEVVILPDAARPTLLGFKTNEIHQVLTMDVAARL